MPTTTQTDIVVVNVSQTLAAVPSQLQRTATLVSQGGTKLTPGSNAILTQLSDLTPLLMGSIAITSAVWAAGIVTLTTTAPHGWPAGETIPGVVAGFTPAAYNGSYGITVVDAVTLTYPLASNPGATSTVGTVTDGDVAEITAMATTWFAQGSATPVYVLELGNGNATDGIAALAAYVIANPYKFYVYEVPKEWAADVTSATALATLCRNHSSTTSMVYFVVTTADDPAVYALFNGIKSAFVIRASSADYGNGIYDASVLGYNCVVQQPSAANKVPPMQFRFAFGVTADDLSGPQQVAFKQAYVNYIATGAEGGISNTLIKWGVTMDGKPFTYWYAVDWMQINLKLNLANEIINGSNNSINPLYYNQPGIGRLQKRAQNTVNSGIQFGMVLATSLGPLVQATSFGDYVTQNPNDYSQGIYNGLSLEFTPQQGFMNIIFNMNVTDFASA